MTFFARMVRWELRLRDKGVDGLWCVAVAFVDILAGLWGCHQLAREIVEKEPCLPGLLVDKHAAALLLIARFGGRIVTVNSALLLLTSCTYFWTYRRSSWLARFLPLDNMMPNWHSRLAIITAVAAALHTVAIVAVYASAPLQWGGSLWRGSAEGIQVTQELVTGILLVVVLGGMVAVPRMRRRHFKAFWVHHQLGVVLYIALLVLHGCFYGWPITWCFLAGPALFYAVDRCFRIFKATTVVRGLAKVTAYADDVIILEFARPYVFRPGMYARICVPQISPYEFHPFTMASSPLEDTIRFYMKVVGDWTRALHELAWQKPAEAGDPTNANNMSASLGPSPSILDRKGCVAFVTVKVSGPFGAPAQHFSQFAKVVLVSTGIGVTPMSSIIRDLFFRRMRLYRELGEGLLRRLPAAKPLPQMPAGSSCEPYPKVRTAAAEVPAEAATFGAQAGVTATAATFISGIGMPSIGQSTSAAALGMQAAATTVKPAAAMAECLRAAPRETTAMADEARAGSNDWAITAAIAAPDRFPRACCSGGKVGVSAHSGAFSDPERLPNSWSDRSGVGISTSIAIEPASGTARPPTAHGTAALRSHPATERGLDISPREPSTGVDSNAWRSSVVSVAASVGTQRRNARQMLASVLASLGKRPGLSVLTQGLGVDVAKESPNIHKLSPWLSLSQMEVMAAQQQALEMHALVEAGARSMIQEEDRRRERGTGAGGSGKQIGHAPSDSVGSLRDSVDIVSRMLGMDTVDEGGAMEDLDDDGHRLGQHSNMRNRAMDLEESRRRGGMSRIRHGCARVLSRLCCCCLPACREWWLRRARMRGRRQGQRVHTSAQHGMEFRLLNKLAARGDAGGKNGAGSWWPRLSRAMVLLQLGWISLSWMYASLFCSMATLLAVICFSFLADIWSLRWEVYQLAALVLAAVNVPGSLLNLFMTLWTLREEAGARGWSFAATMRAALGGRAYIGR